MKRIYPDKTPKVFGNTATIAIAINSRLVPVN